MNIRSRVAVAAMAIVTICTPIGDAAASGRPHPSVVDPSRRVFMVSDSVGLGAKTAMPAAFPSDWQVTVTGKPALFVDQLVDQYVRYQPLSAFGDNAIVAGGYNYTYWDKPRFDRAIDYMVNTLKSKGVDRIYWVTMREVKPAYFSGWNSLSSAYRTLYLAYPGANQQLRDATMRHPELSIIDWAYVADRTGLTYDAIHLNTTGANIYSQLAATAVTTGASREPAGTTSEITVAGVGGVPADATAVSVNLTAVNPRTNGYLTAYPCGGTRPTVSNVNYLAGRTMPTAAIVPIGVDGKICVYQHADAHVLVDVNGAFGATSGFVDLLPNRALDTRSGAPPGANTTIEARVGDVAGAPDGAFVAVVNVTVIGGAASTNLRVFTCGTPVPALASRTINAGLVQSLMLVVATDGDGDVCVTTSQSVHVLVDLFGAFVAGADVHPLPPTRVLNTATSGGPLVPGFQRVALVGGAGGVPSSPLPVGVIVTVSGVAAAQGFVTAFPCAPTAPDTSALNLPPNRELANTVVTTVDWLGQVCLLSNVSTNVTVDVSGWIGAAFIPLAPLRVLDTRN